MALLVGPAVEAAIALIQKALRVECLRGGTMIVVKQQLCLFCLLSIRRDLNDLLALDELRGGIDGNGSQYF